MSVARGRAARPEPGTPTRGLHGCDRAPRGVIVIGGGSPGEHCAAAIAAGGLRVALVEHELVGGECSYRACMPSETLLRPGEAVHGAREAAATADVDVAAALAHRDFMVSDHTDAGQERFLADSGIDPLRGTGRLAGHGIAVDARLRAGERLWAVGDVTGIWPLTHTGKYQGDIVAANLLGESREANYDAVPA